MAGDLRIGLIEMGASGKNPDQINLSFPLEDQVFNGRRCSSAVYLQGGTELLLAPGFTFRCNR